MVDSAIFSPLQMRLERSERLRNEALYKAAIMADQVGYDMIAYMP